MIKTVCKHLLLGGIITGLMAAPAAASVVIDFSTGLAGAGGTITKSGGTITGHNILIDALTVAGAPMNDGVWNVDGAGSGAAGPTGLLNFTTTTHGGGTFTITGSVPGLGISSVIPLVVSGTFSRATLGGGFFSGSGLDVKNDTLLAALGIPAGTPFSFFGFSSYFGRGNTVISSDYKNSPVPEPGSLFLLGTGLLGVTSAARRRRMRG